MPTTQPRRGAPDGNTNAVKHGFYSRRFNRKEKNDLEGFTITDLVSEIQMMRVLARRTFDACADTEDPQELKSLLRVAAFATQTINRLVRTQHQVKPDDAVNPYEKAYFQALHEVLAEQRGGEPLPWESSHPPGGGSQSLSGGEEDLDQDLPQDPSTVPASWCPTFRPEDYPDDSTPPPAPPLSLPPPSPTSVFHPQPASSSPSTPNSLQSPIHSFTQSLNDPISS